MAIVLALLPRPREARRGRADNAPEYACEVALVEEPELERDVGDRTLALDQQALRALDPMAHDVAHRALAGALPEQAREVEAADARGSRHVVEPHAVAEVRVDETARTIQRARGEAASANA